MYGRIHAPIDSGEGLDYKASPREWLPLLLEAYDTVGEVAGKLGVGVVVAGAGAYALHVEADPTKDVDLVLTKPLPIEKLARILEEASEKLEEKGWKITGGRIQQGRSSEDWVIQLFVSPSPGRIIGLEVFNLLAVRPLSLYEVEEKAYGDKKLKTLTLESWIASKLADPNGVDTVNQRRLEKAVEEKQVDIPKLYQILMRLGLDEIIKANARSLLHRTRNPKLKRILQPLA